MMRFSFPFPPQPSRALILLPAFLDGRGFSPRIAMVMAIAISAPVSVSGAAAETTVPASVPDMVLSANRPNSNHGNFPLHIDRLEAVSTARGALARVAVTLTLSVSPPEEVGIWNTEGVLSFAPAPGWTVTGAALDVSGDMRPASLTPSARAVTAYKDVVSRNIDPCLVRLQPDGRVKVNVFPITRNKPRHLRLEFSGVLTPGKAGLEADFPMRFPQPVPDAALTTDFDPARPPVTVARPGFSGGPDARLTQPLPTPASPWTSEPDGQDSSLFQGLLPAELLHSPKHLLVVSDNSWCQQTADRTSQFTILQDLLQRMIFGKVTLAAFSTLPESTVDFQVAHGECPALLRALDTMPGSGAPRPGAVDVGDIPCDLVVILSTLADPLGSGGLPKLPVGVPVVVIDTVSRSPSIAARRLAETSGGVLLQRGSDAIPEGRKPLNLKTDFPPGTRVRMLPGRDWWLVTGRMPDKTDRLPASGSRPEIVPGNDPAAGRLQREADGREALRNLLESPTTITWSAPPDVVRDYPILTPETSLIVLENISDYIRHGIAPPRGLTASGTASRSDPAAAASLQYGDYELVAEALYRAPRTEGNSQSWWEKLTGWKKTDVGVRLRRMQQFRPENPSGSSIGLSKKLRAVILQLGISEEQIAAAEQADTVLPALEHQYQNAAPGERASLLNQALGIQVDRLNFFQYWYMLANESFRSGPSPGLPADMFSMEALVTSPRAGYLSQSGASTADATVADPSLSVDPFAVFGSDDSGADANSSSSGADAATGPENQRGPDRHPAARNGPASSKVEDSFPTGPILAKAISLRQSGKASEALRVITELALPEASHSRLRLLAWQLLEWDQPALALEVLRQARRLFGDNDTTLRDLALALRDTGHREAADRLLSRVSGGVANRELAALRQQKPGSPSGLRVVMECASSDADADLEIEGPDDERAFWRHPLPAFGGALSFDGTGFIPEDFLLPQTSTTTTAPAPAIGTPASPVAAPAETSTGQLPFPLTIRVRLRSVKPEPVRVTVFHHWGSANPSPQTFLLPACQPGVTTVTRWPEQP